MTENYRGCYEYLSAQYPEVGGYEFYKELFPDNENSGERHTDFPIRTLCICIGTNRARIRSSGAGRCITTHGNMITWSLSRGTALLCAAVLHIAERRTGWRTPSGCML